MGDPGGIKIDLFVSKAISDAFSREVEAGNYDTVGALYKRWLRIVLKILPQRSHDHMSCT